MRHREKADKIGPGNIFLGYGDFDIKYPYGDGPWYAPPSEYKKVIAAETYVERESCTDELHKGPPYRTGGPLDIVKFTTEQYDPRMESTLYGSRYRYRGKFLPSRDPSDYLDYDVLSSWEALKLSDYGDVSEYGAKGWNRFRPTRSGAELGVFLGEIREVPRMLMTTAKGFHNIWKSMGGSPQGFGPKAVANHWLNTQFGWFPFLSDLRDFYNTVKDLDKKLKQLRRDNGRWIRRRGTVSRTSEVEVVAESTTVPGLVPVLYTQLYNIPYGGYRVVRSNTQRVWFEGAFRYWIPGKPDSWEWNVRAYALLFGVQPSPSLLWELTPWSWLIDWCSDAGDAIANMSSILFDNLCARYAYIMGTTTQEATSTGWSNFKSGYLQNSWSASLTRKKREQASPFGFGLSSSSFSTRQWSILAALGLTRLR